MENAYLKTTDEVLRKLNSSNSGLEDNEIKKRLSIYGRNRLEGIKKESDVKKFFRQFNDGMILILLAAAFISFFVSLFRHESYLDSIIILIIVILNALMGFLQEKKADKSVESLKKLSTPFINVRRNNYVKSINVEELVPGDIILFTAGDIIPADARLLESSSLTIDESSLTGESCSVSKNIEKLKDVVSLGLRSNMVFQGSSVLYGRGEAVVTETGIKTELGNIAQSISEKDEVLTPLQIKIKEISKVLSILIAIIIVIMFFIGKSNGYDTLEILLLSISLAVAAIPEGLPAVVTITLSLGMDLMAKKNVIIRKISSVETLGSTEIICSDKTGTITQNKMRIEEVLFNNHLYDRNDEILNADLLIQAMMLCNDVLQDEKNELLGDPTEIALVVYAETKSFAVFDIKEKMDRVEEIPFDSERKMMSTIHSIAHERIMFTKGSFDSVMERTTKLYFNGNIIPLNPSMREELKNIEKSLSKRALRILCFAYKMVDKYDTDNLFLLENDLIFLGLTGMMDPPREFVKEAIDTCFKAGIRPIMITGDSLETASAIAKNIGILSREDEAILGMELDKFTDEEMKKNVPNYSVYARVSPEHKKRIVKAWQDNGKIVAMTGDGVNDAPSIKMAHIGIGMGITGTEVTKNVSDVILADDCFNTIVYGIREGRRIYDNIRNVIIYLLTGNFGEVLIVFVGMILRVDIFLPVQLLYINLITDSIPAIALSFEKESENIMSRTVRDTKENFFTPFIIARIVSSSIFKAMTMLLIYFLSKQFFGAEYATTLTFLSLVLLEMFYAFSCKNPKEKVFGKKLFDNVFMNKSMIFLSVLQILVFVTPIRVVFGLVMIKWQHFFFVLLLCILLFFVDELSKPLIKKLFKD